MKIAVELTLKQIETIFKAMSAAPDFPDDLLIAFIVQVTSKKESLAQTLIKTYLKDRL